jgi:hypothetical protein
LWWDLHPKEIWRSADKLKKGYVEWLQKLQVPIFMQQAYGEIPAALRYPKERIMAEYPWRYFTSQTAWMIALALSEGVTHLGFFGIHYQMQSEYARQRAGCEFWMGIAAGKGVQLVIPSGCPLLHEPNVLYGYESHKDGTWALLDKSSMAGKALTVISQPE